MKGISIIVPIYNTKPFLVECLDSVRIAVEGLQAEVLLIDDGSTDGSSGIAKDYADKHEGFYYYYQENGGVSKARNYGVSLAKGKYISFVDSDDLVAPLIFRDMLFLAEKNHSPLTICNVTNCEGPTKFFASTTFQTVFRGRPKMNSHIKEDPWLIFDSAVWNKLIRRDFWENFHLRFKEDCCYEDMPISLMLYWYADHVSVLQSFGYYWRRRKGKGDPSITQHLNDLKYLEDKMSSHSFLWDFLEKNDKDKSVALLKMLKKRLFAFDFDPFINNLDSMDEKDQRMIVHRIASYFRSFISKLDGVRFDEYSAYHQAIIKNILDEDIPSLLRLINHKKMRGADQLSQKKMRNIRFYFRIQFTVLLHRMRQ